VTSSVYAEQPSAFLEVRVEEIELDPGLYGFCIGYESGEWRSEQFADYLFHYLPEFALSASELARYSPATAHHMLRRAAEVVYGTDRYARRGEFGELILHAVLRRHFDSEPAVSKLYYKDSSNDTVKGFDCVHAVVGADGELELWLGEAKFYTDARQAIRNVIEELKLHLDSGFMRSEFALVSNKIDPTWEHAEALRRLIDEHTSLDRIVSRLRVPVLVTYDSDVVAAHDSIVDPYPEEFEREVRDLHDAFVEAEAPTDVTIELLLMPLADKAEFVKALHGKLEAWQRI
jgi:hypothetical protein